MRQGEKDREKERQTDRVREGERDRQNDVKLTGRDSIPASQPECVF